ncbi:hypothetical protein F0562_032366 [Nyssa sinensis]|uniref:Uncharacterized protein n=1 Tax=Nyssa sinensis TaxID=561372 RepID=A0A5J5AQ49_9ASTE|nr:hypothetical protein F0562_032366 [Nyssa sinensis]
MLSNSPIRIDHAGKSGDETHASDAVAATPADTSSYDSSIFYPFLPRIKDDSELAAFIVEYQGTFPKYVILNLGREELFGVPCNHEGFIKFYLVWLLDSNEFWASYIVKRMGNRCYNVSPRGAILIQNLPRGEKRWDNCTLEIGGA